MTNFQPFTVLKAADLNSAIDAKLDKTGGIVSGPVSINGALTLIGGGLTLPGWTTGTRPAAATGMIGWNSSTLQAELYNGTAWSPIGSGGGGAGALLAANNLSDLANVATARGNLGLGSASTRNVSSTASNVVASLTGSFTPGHIITVADSSGTLQDGGAPTSGTSGALLAANNLSDLGNVATSRANLGLGTAATKNASGTGVVISGAGAFTTGHLAVFTDSSGTIQDGGAPSSGTAGALVAANNLSDVANVTTARANLGLGTAATKAASSASATTLVAVTGAITAGHMLVFADGVGTAQDGGAPGTGGGSAGGSRTVSGTGDTLAASDNGGVVFYTSASPVTVTVPSTLAAGFLCTLIQQNIGQVTVAAGTGVTLQSDTNDTSASSFTSARQGAWLGVAMASGSVCDVAGHTVKGEQITLSGLPAVTTPVTTDKLAGTYAGADGEATVSSVLALAVPRLSALPAATTPASTDKIAGTFGGTDGEATVSSILALSTGGGGGSTATAVKNYITNAKFRVQQRGAGPWTAANPLGTLGAVTADRWGYAAGANGARSIQVFPGSDYQRSWGIQEDIGYFVQYNITATGTAATDLEYIGQVIEDVTSLSGKTVTFSCWAYQDTSSSAMNVGLELVQNFGTGGAPSATITGIGARTLSLPGITGGRGATWTRLTATIALPSVVGKTLGTNNDSSTQIGIWLSAGSNFATRASNIGLQAIAAGFWGAQLEVGSTANALETRTLRYEVAECQRHYFSCNGVWVDGYSGVAGQGLSTNIPFPVTMRGVPAVTAAATGTSNVASTSIALASTTGFQPIFTSTAAGRTNGTWSTLNSSAELPLV